MMTSGIKLASHLPLHDDELSELAAFCDPETDRYTVLTESLKRRNIAYETIPLGEAKHIALPVPNPRRMDDEYYRVTLTAHYDRVSGTPGANDNAAAVFQLMTHWQEISRLGWRHRTQIIFTDREELTGEMSATDQGSWHLAKHLSRLGADNILFFVLDMCGIGDTPVWGRSVRKAGLIPAGDSISRAFEVMESFLKRYTRGCDYGVNPLFSDDLGLLLGGYPAFQLSLLPRSEAENLAALYRNEPFETDPEAPARAREKTRNNLPQSWKANHTLLDTPQTLEAGSFHLMSRLLRDLARYRFPLPSGRPLTITGA